MTKEQIVNFRDKVAKDKMIKIVCDNQHIFYDNIAQYPPVIWDDDNETFTIIRVNQDAGGHDKYPFETVQTSYEHIQFIHCFDTTETAIKLMNELGSGLTDEQMKHFKKYLAEAGYVRMNKDLNYSNSAMYSRP